MDIGTARIRLVVDSEEFDGVVAQGRNAIRGFGSEAQTAYDKTERATRRAADALLAYVNSIGRADATMDRYVRNASALGVENSIIDAAVSAWRKHNNEVILAAQAQDDHAEVVKKTQAAYKQLVAEQQQYEKAARAAENIKVGQRVEAAGQQFAANAQQQINSRTGVGMMATGAGDYVYEASAQERAIFLAQRRADAEAAFLPIVQAEIKAEKELAQARTAAADSAAQQRAANAQQQINTQLKVEPTSMSNGQTAYGVAAGEKAVLQAQRRADAEAAFLPIVQAEIKAEKELAQARAGGEAFIKQLESLQQAAGKDYYELMRMKAAQLGVSSEAIPLIAQLEATNKQMGMGTISAKQYQQAMRGLPAQFTDVVVSLAAGQNPFMVFLQQGGQVKDMFGGVGVAARAVGQALRTAATAALTNPWVLLATALAVVAAAAYKAQERVAAFALAAAKGDMVSGTTESLTALADRLRAIDGISLSNADAAVQALGATGKLTGENLAVAAETAARWATATGEAVDDVVKHFEEIQDDPLKAMEDGLVKVTDAQYAHINALIEEGNAQQAVSELVGVYQGQVNAATVEVVQHQNLAQLAWGEITRAIGTATHAVEDFVLSMLDSLGNGFRTVVNWGIALANTFVGLINKVDAGIARITNGKPMPIPVIASFKEGEFTASLKRRATSAARAAGPVDTGAPKLTVAQIKANKDLDKAWEDSGNEADKYSAKVKALNATLRNASPAALAAKGIKKNANGTFSGEGYDQLLEAAKESAYGKPKKGRKAGGAGHQGPEQTADIKAWEKTELAAVKEVQQAYDWMYADHEISAEEYYTKSIELARKEADIQIESNNKQAAALAGRRDSADKIAALQQQNQTIEQNFATKKAKLDRDELVAVRQRVAALRDYVQALQDANVQVSRGFDSKTRSVGMGDRAAESASALSDAAYTKQQNSRKIEEQLADKKISSDEAAKRQQAEADAYEDKVRRIIAGYGQLGAAEADWSNGANKAWDNWLVNVQDIASQIDKITTNLLTGLSDSIANFISTGTGGFRTMFDDINKQIVQFIVKQQLTNFLQWLGKQFEGLGSTASGLFNSLFGSILGGSSGSSGVSSVLSLGSSLLTMGGLFPSAQGNAFSAGSGLANYRNSIVSNPTYFPFARGGVPNVGLMGERAGPGEAIMPLTRTNGGDLAVRATGVMPPQQTTVNQTFVVPGAVNRSTQDQLSVRMLSAAQRATRRN